MDPFNEVEEDCWQQIRALEEFSALTTEISEDAKLDFRNIHQELVETLNDLRQAVVISESNPAQFNLNSLDIASRKQILAKLLSKVQKLDDDWTVRQSSRPKLREVTTMSNRISQDNTSENPFDERNRIDLEFNQLQQQEALQQQDLQLDSIHQTMQNLNQQANLMGSELEDQAYMLDELDQEMDSVGNKLQRGLKRVNYVIEKNKETASNWCIGILMVVLTVLLVILFIA